MDMETEERDTEGSSDGVAVSTDPLTRALWRRQPGVEKLRRRGIGRGGYWSNPLRFDPDRLGPGNPLRTPPQRQM